MSQVSYGTIAITDLTDIKDMYLQYCMAVDSITTAAAIEAKTTWTSPEVNWFTLTADTTVNSNKRYYRLSSGDYYVVTPIGSENPSSNGWYEDTTYPSWQSGYQIWIREVRIKEGIELPEYGTPYLDKAVNQINTRIKKIWSNSTGSYMASGTESEVDIDDSSTYGFNSKSTTTGVSFNYNAIPLTSLGTDGLKLYSPILTNSVITGNRLDATLTSEGLKLLKGGIEAGTKNTTDYIYVYSHDDATNHTLTINNSGSKSDWRIIAGNKFGVDKAGNLYASNANVEGAITATSLTIGSGSDAYDGTAAINISGYDVEIEKNGTDETEGVTVYLYPILYHNGERVPDTEIDYTHFVWYQDDSTIGTEGSATDGSYLATYGHNYRVVYDFDDGAVGGGTEVQTRTIDPSKYITKISDTGITIHPEVWSNQSSYIQLDGNGMELFNNSGSSIAQYGSTARIGLNNSSRFLINNNSLEGYDNNNNKYFEVNSNGLSWGSNTAATVSQFNTLNNYIDTHLAVTSEGLVLSADSNTKVLIATGGTGHTYENAGTYIIDGSDNVLAQFLGNGAQIGQSGAAHSVIDTNGQRFYARNGTTQLANIGYGEGVNSSGGTSNAPYYLLGLQRTASKQYDPSYAYEVGDVCLYDGKTYVCTINMDAPEAWTQSHWIYSIGNYSVATGRGAIAAGYASTAEGSYTCAIGGFAHAEGYDTHALGDGSHAGGLHTITNPNRNAQTVIGQYNIQDTSVPDILQRGGQLLIIGNGIGIDGADNERSNALVVDWDGQVQCQGAGSLNGTYNEIYLGDYSNRAKQINSSLTTSSSDNLWLTAVLKAICVDYPNKQFVIFKGRLAPNSQGYFKIMIYDTSNVSGGMPQYAYGTWNKWQHTFWLISTNSYAFAYVAK